MTRLPQPGGDQGNWGTILNEYLSEAHNPDGTIKPGVIDDTSIADGSITPSKLSVGAGTNGQLLALNGAGFSWTTVSGGGSGLQPSNNLSDLTNATTARSNLGLGTAATQAVSAFDAAGAATAAVAKTDANIFWDGIVACPLRSTATSDVNRRVRWISPASPLTTTGYALPGDVWEAVA